MPQNNLPQSVGHRWFSPLWGLGKFFARLWKAQKRLPLLRPTRYVYFVAYSYGASSEAEKTVEIPLDGYTLKVQVTRNGTGSVEIFMNYPVSDFNDVLLMSDSIVDLGIKKGYWPEDDIPSVAITNYKLMHKEVLIKGEWVYTHRQPKPA